jgi:hypothetical protein
MLLQWLLALSLAAIFQRFSAAQIYADNIPATHPAIDYLSVAPDDPVSRLAIRIRKAEITLDFRRDGTGFLVSLLQHLGIDPDTQALVFSKSSFQSGKISPRNPRAIYFNDEVAVGYVRGGEGLEVAALDPRQGMIFYTLDRTGEQPVFTRREICLRCHQGPSTMGVPGIFVGSVYPNALGIPAREGAIVTDHRTPFEDRWGGWYVDAARGHGRDRSNATAPDPADPTALEPLPVKFDPAGYLNPVSDIVALMTLEHQTQMINLITRLGWKARMATQTDADLEATLQYMFFTGEAPLSEPVQGISLFTRTFPQRGPRDSGGRSLRDFDLHTRLFRYPLSYMVYSPAFDALPDNIRERLYHRMFHILTGADRSPAFAMLSAADRLAILEILRDTKPQLPAYWRSSAGPRR